MVKQVGFEPTIVECPNSILIGVALQSHDADAICDIDLRAEGLRQALVAFENFLRDFALGEHRAALLPARLPVTDIDRVYPDLLELPALEFHPVHAALPVVRR